MYKKSPTLISCPTCGRTQIKLIPIAKEIESFLQGIEENITVAVMGCRSEWTTEKQEKQILELHGGIKEGLLFKKGEVIKKVPQEKIVEVLKQEILDMI